MATTRVEICNMALDNLGVTNKIASLDPNGGKESRACARWYEQTGLWVLRQFPWPFASFSVELVASDVTHPEWAYVYDLPSDFLKFRRLFIAGQARTEPSLPGGVVMVNATTGARKVVCSTAGAYLQYTKKMVDGAADTLVPLLPAEFVDALAWKLATKLVIPLALNTELLEAAETMYRAAVATAYAMSVEELTFDPAPDSELITCRG